MYILLENLSNGKKEQVTFIVLTKNSFPDVFFLSMFSIYQYLNKKIKPNFYTLDL